MVFERNKLHHVVDCTRISGIKRLNGAHFLSHSITELQTLTEYKRQYDGKNEYERHKNDIITCVAFSMTTTSSRKNIEENIGIICAHVPNICHAGHIPNLSVVHYHLVLYLCRAFHIISLLPGYVWQDDTVLGLSVLTLLSNFHKIN